MILLLDAFFGGISPQCGQLIVCPMNLLFLVFFFPPSFVCLHQLLFNPVIQSLGDALGKMLVN